MDPATLAFDTATALTAALALLFSRLDSRHHRSTEQFDLRAELLVLSITVSSWEEHARRIDRAMRGWAEGQLDDFSTQMMLMRDELPGQTAVSTRALTVLYGKDEISRRIDHIRYGKGVDEYPFTAIEDPKSPTTEHFLRVYGPEVLEVLKTGFHQRRAVVEKLIAELTYLRAAEPEVIQTTVTRLESATEELSRASTQLNTYVRENVRPW